MSDKLWFDDNNDSEFVWLSNNILFSSSALLIIGDKLLDLLSDIVFTGSTLFFNIWVNDDISFVVLLSCVE